MRIPSYISQCLLLIIACCGCRGSSELEMKQAQKAMDEARSIHADRLAPTNFQQAQKAWDHALAAEKEGKTATAKVLFESAKIYSGKAADIATSKQDALSRELSSIQLTISSNFDQVKSDLSKTKLSPKQHDQVKAIAVEIEKGNASISKLVEEEDLVKAVATAKAVQTKIYHAQLILAGQRIN
jgi:hypothetical protein